MMDIRIYQIDSERDTNGVMYTEFDQLEKWQGDPNVHADLYDLVFEGSVDETDLEGVYRRFNYSYEYDYEGRSLSMSDVVEVRSGAEEKPGFYYCDKFGFTTIDFNPELTGRLEDRKIKVVMVEPGKQAYVTEIGTELYDLQKAVVGCIETYYPFPDEGYQSGCGIVCNDEGKINGMTPNRAIYDENHEIMDIIFGPFFICDCSKENFGSLSPEQLDGFMKEFKYPEHFYSDAGKIVAVPYVVPPERAGTAR